MAFDFYLKYCHPDMLHGRNELNIRVKGLFGLHLNFCTHDSPLITNLLLSHMIYYILHEQTVQCVFHILGMYSNPAHLLGSMYIDYLCMFFPYINKHPFSLLKQWS